MPHWASGPPNAKLGKGAGCVQAHSQPLMRPPPLTGVATPLSQLWLLAAVLHWLLTSAEWLLQMFLLLQPPPLTQPQLCSFIFVNFSQLLLQDFCNCCAAAVAVAKATGATWYGKSSNVPLARLTGVSRVGHYLNRSFSHFTEQPLWANPSLMRASPFQDASSHLSPANRHHAGASPAWLMLRMEIGWQNSNFLLHQYEWIWRYIFLVL